MRRLAQTQHSATPLHAALVETHYQLLGIHEEASAEELKKAFRQKALLQHPDKGGDEDKFDEIKKAHAVLEDSKKREAYDEQLAKQRERDELVEGGPSRAADTSGAIREKTAPTPGSKCSSKKQAIQIGYKVLGSANVALKAIKDDATPEAQSEMLFQKYKALPHHKEMRKKWSRNLIGEDKVNLKNHAKKHEQAQMQKWQKWLAPEKEVKDVKKAPKKTAFQEAKAKEKEESNGCILVKEEVKEEVKEVVNLVK